MVAILAMTGRLNLRTTGRARTALTVNEAYGMAGTAVRAWRAAISTRAMPM